MYSQSIEFLNPFEALCKTIDERNRSNESVTLLQKTKTKRRYTMKIQNILRTVLLIIATLFIIISAIGALAVPIILSFNYSWHWLFCYIGYLIIAAPAFILHQVL